ncbi:MAG: histidine kinase [Colwellia sp.]
MINIVDKYSIESSLEIEPQAFSKQNHQFWVLQILGWLGYAFIVFLAIIRPQFDDPNFNLSGQMINLMVETMSGFFLSYLQWLLIQKIVHLPLKKILLLSFSFAAILGMVYNIIKLSAFKIIVHHQQWNEAWDMLEFGGWLLFSLTTMFAWTSIFFIMLYNTKLQKEHEMLLRAQTSEKDAQLQMLRYQLNPHFMFNTMNAISTLIYKHENDKANEMLDKLCEFFRYTLDQNEKSKTTLQKELELLDIYLSIEKVRFAERLTINRQVCDSVLDCQVPSMLLQPLVENAVKYAIEPRKQAGFITITAEKINDRLVIDVLDNGNGQNQNVSNGLGIGITNTKARLEAMFNGHYDIKIAENSYHGTTVTISMPLKK